MNKKGDVPITLLVIGVFAICGLALLSFYVADVKVKRTFVGIDLVEKLNINVEKYEVYENKDYVHEEIMEELNNADLSDRNFYYVEKMGDTYLEINKTKNKFQFDFKDWKEKEFLFSAKYYLN